MEILESLFYNYDIIFGGFKISEDADGNITIISQLDEYSHLSFDDIKRIIWSIIGRNDVKVSYNTKEHISGKTSCYFM